MQLSSIVRFFIVALFALLLVASAEARTSRPAVTNGRAQSSYTETILHRFDSFLDGVHPVGLIVDGFGDLYGVTEYGGSDAQACALEGCGVAFKLTHARSHYIERSVFEFGVNEHLAIQPAGGLVRERDGDFFGAVEDWDGAGEYGFVLKLTPTQPYGFFLQDLYDFQGPPNAGTPIGRVVVDAKGSIYGISLGGVGCAFGCGTVYKLTKHRATYTESVLHLFQGLPDGDPVGGLVIDASGALYGTTVNYSNDCRRPEASTVLNACGAVFRLAPQPSGEYAYTALHRFIGTGNRDGLVPYNPLLLDASGTLYGTADGGGAYGQGVAFALTPQSSGAYSETILYSFRGGSDGTDPTAALTEDGAGNLFGVTYYGGDGPCHKTGCGTVYELAKTGSLRYHEHVLYRFTGHPDGAYPSDALVLQNGNLFGTTWSGGRLRRGIVFELSPST